MAEQINQESLSAPLLNVNGDLTDVRTQIIVASIPPKYSPPTVVLVMEASQYFFALISTLILSIFGNGLIPILWPIYWIPLFAGLIYIGSYITVWCMNHRLKDSSFSVILMFFVILSELVLLSYLSMVWKPFLVFAIISIFMISVLMSAGYAQCMQSRFSAPGARLVALFTILCAFVIFAIFLDRKMLIVLAVFTSILALYEWFMIAKVEKFVRLNQEASKFVEATYFTLRVFKSKFEWIFIIFTCWITVFKSYVKRDVIIDPIREP